VSTENRDSGDPPEPRYPFPFRIHRQESLPTERSYPLFSPGGQVGKCRICPPEERSGQNAVFAGMSGRWRGFPRALYRCSGKGMMENAESPLPVKATPFWHPGVWNPGSPNPGQDRAPIPVFAKPDLCDTMPVWQISQSNSNRFKIFSVIQSYVCFRKTQWYLPHGPGSRRNVRAMRSCDGTFSERTLCTKPGARPLAGIRYALPDEQ